MCGISLSAFNCLLYQFIFCLHLHMALSTNINKHLAPSLLSMHFTWLNFGHHVKHSHYNCMMGPWPFTALPLLLHFSAMERPMYICHSLIAWGFRGPIQICNHISMLYIFILVLILECATFDIWYLVFWCHIVMPLPKWSCETCNGSTKPTPPYGQFATTCSPNVGYAMWGVGVHLLINTYK